MKSLGHVPTLEPTTGICASDDWHPFCCSWKLQGHEKADRWSKVVVAFARIPEAGYSGAPRLDPIVCTL